MTSRIEASGTNGLYFNNGEEIWAPLDAILNAKIFRLHSTESIHGQYFSHRQNPNDQYAASGRKEGRTLRGNGTLRIRNTNEPISIRPLKAMVRDV